MRFADATNDGLGTRVLSAAQTLLKLARRSLIAAGGRVADRRMAVIETLSLGNRRQLFLVACGQQRFLLGASADRISTIVAMPGTLESAAESAAGAQNHGATPGTARACPGHFPLGSGGVSVAGCGLRLVKGAKGKPAGQGAPSAEAAGWMPW